MSGVQVRGNLKARPDGKFDDRLAATIGERLIALEKANRGGGSAFVSPTVPAFGGGGPGPAGPAGAPGAPGAPGATDHGALTGLEDDDHPQYVHREQGAVPHVHTPESLGLDSQFSRRFERAQPQAHPHRMADVADLRPDDVQFVISARMFGG